MHPGKSLLRFKCISKAWNTWIQQPHFMKLHNARSQTRPTRLLFQLEVVCDGDEDLVRKEKKLGLEKVCVEPLVAARHYFYYKDMLICSNHCNGLICLYSVKDTQVYLYIITTGNDESLDDGPILFLGFDLKTEKYKLIEYHLADTITNGTINNRILTLGMDSSWRRIKRPSNCLIRDDPNFVKSHIARSQARPTATRLLFDLYYHDNKRDVAVKENKKRRIEGFPLELQEPRHYFNYEKMRTCSNHCNGLICLYKTCSMSPQER
ncbi:hypothetical protein CQW23_20766 [Capsicum baccatum]|uniref:F-box associated domain-containing protein n=1 Tax=Capsicum baccatum TaxID=33114 RepID=A0A2G2W9N6_CAPBA|nr:hypothetical protein CQW23_20766 [Capsicum baccatum]